MNPIIFQEIKQNNDIAWKDTHNDSKRILESHETLVEAIAQVIKLSYIARKEGILALEEAAYQLPKEDVIFHLSYLVELIVDGTDPSIVEDLGLCRYCASGYKGLNALEYLIYLVGVLSIQAGENPRVTEERLLSMISIDAQQLYRDQVEKQLQQSAKQSKEQDEAETEKLMQGLFLGDKVNISSDTPGYFSVSLLDYILRSLDDRAIQRLLRDMENRDLALSLKVLSGTGRKKILTNLSSRIAKMIATDYIYFGVNSDTETVTIDAVQAVEKMLKTLFILEDTGEIVMSNSVLMTGLYELFVTRPVDYKNDWEKSKKRELEHLLKEYFDPS